MRLFTVMHFQSSDASLYLGVIVSTIYRTCFTTNPFPMVYEDNIAISYRFDNFHILVLDLFFANKNLP